MTRLYPRALGSLSVASYNSQDYGGGILSRLHTEAYHWMLKAGNYMSETSLRVRHQKIMTQIVTDI
jgi:hypothetical protein